jgi:hypothetical protein
LVLMNSATRTAHYETMTTEALIAAHQAASRYLAVAKGASRAETVACLTAMVAVLKGRPEMA